jgi:hypothetical protein
MSAPTATTLHTLDFEYRNEYGAWVRVITCPAEQKSCIAAMTCCSLCGERVFRQAAPNRCNKRGCACGAE